MNLGECMEYAGKLSNADTSAERSAARNELRAVIEQFVAAEIAQERERNEADAKDAARYRWLRNRVPLKQPEDSLPEIFIGVDSPRHPNRWALAGDEADAAIDAALKANSQGGE